MVEVFVHLVPEVMVVATGHLVLWLVSLGRWDVANGRESIAILVGLAFWIGVGASVWVVFFR